MDWLELECEKLKRVDLQSDNLSKFIEEWNYFLRYNTRTLYPAYLESTFLKQIYEELDDEGMPWSLRLHGQLQGP